jgi:hypothetical protein
VVHVMMPAPARAPEYTAHRAKGQAQQEERNQDAKAAKAHKREVTMKWHPKTVIWNWLAASLNGGRLDILRGRIGHAGVEGEKGDARNGGQQYQPGQDSEYNVVRHFMLLMKMLISSEI